MPNSLKPINKCGYVALVGRPNVGKSTLLNRILGQKISITSRKPQTTRHRIIGIKSEDGSQAVYVDTPGLRFARRRKAKEEHRENHRQHRTGLQDGHTHHPRKYGPMGDK